MNECSRNIVPLRVVVDSRDRNRSVFPNPSYYEIALANTVENVWALELVSADVPFSNFLVSRYRRRIPFRVWTDPLHPEAFVDGVAVLPIEYHGVPNDLVIAIQLAFRTALDALGMTTVEFRVTYGARLDTFVFEGTHAFALRWSENRSVKDCFARVLGFFAPYVDETSTVVGVGRHVLPCIYPWNPNVDRYLILHVDDAPVCISDNPSTQNAFAILPRREHPDSPSFSSRVAHDRWIKVYQPQMSRFSKLRISFHDYEGHEYDFQNFDHRLEFVLHRHQRSLFLPSPGVICPPP